MFKYKYPNLQREEVEAFCNDLLFLLGSRKEMKEEEKFLTGMLKRASKGNELIFLHDNDDYIMQKNYAEFYVDPIRKYQNSTHIFDVELEVKDEVENQIAWSENISKNYEFVDSKTNIFVQLSDVVEGIFGKMFQYINSNSINQLRKDIDSLSKLQIDNILLIDKLRSIADKENTGFLCSIAPIDEVIMINKFFEMVRNKSKNQYSSIINELV